VPLVEPIKASWYATKVATGSRIPSPILAATETPLTEACSWFMVFDLLTG